jgi:hypothetical protein
MRSPMGMAAAEIVAVDGAAQSTSNNRCKSLPLFNTQKVRLLKRDNNHRDNDELNRDNNRDNDDEDEDLVTPPARVTDEDQPGPGALSRYGVGHQRPARRD